MKERIFMGLIFTAIVGTVLAFSIFSKPFAKIEEYLIERFSHATSTRRWFSVWVLVYIFWIFIHINFLGHQKWYSPDLDFILVTGLFSAVPFWVENSLKRGQAQFNELLISLVNNNNTTLEKLVSLTRSVQTALGRAEAEEEAMFTLVEKLVNSLEVNKDGEQMESPDGPTQVNEPKSD